MDVRLCLFVIGTFILGSKSQYVPVYGYPGAAQTLSTGKTLHYYIKLNQCRQIAGVGFPEFDDPFGSHVTKWRSLNEENTFISFYEQIPVLNSVGRLESLSREVRILSNGTSFVTTTTFTPDFSSLSYEYLHECTMATPTTPGSIEFRALSTTPARLTSFTQILNALEAGEYVRFNAKTSLCPGGSVHNFIGLGGHVPNYCLIYDSAGVVSEIKVSVQTTYHHEIPNNFAAVIDLTISRDNTVTIVDTHNSLPNFIPEGQRVTKCPLATSTSGGVFNVYI